jgi:tape measure domain-containing protein
MPGLYFEASVNMKQLEQDLRLGSQSVQDFVRQNEAAASKIDSIYKNAATALAAYFSFDAMEGLTDQIIDVRGQMQQLQISFTTMLGSKDAADQLLAQVVMTAAKTPFSLTDLAQGTKQLLAYGESAKTVNSTLVRLGNISAGLSVPIDRLIMAYGQVQAKGKLQGDDMRQFTEAGIPMIGELAKKFGVADSEISKMVESGKVGFNDVKDVINNMTNAGGKFYNLMEAQSDSLPGRISNLGDSIDQMFNKMGADNQATIEGVIDSLGWMVDNYQEFIDILKIAVATYGTYRAAVIAVSIAEKVRYQVTLAQMASTQSLTTLQALQAMVLGKVKDAQALLNKTMLANPYVAAATAIAALVTTLVLFANTATAAERAADKLGEINKDASDGAKEEQNKIDGLVAAIRSEVSTREQKNAALKKLNDIMPDNLGYITEEAVRTGRATEVIDTYIRSVERQIKIDAIREELKKSQQRVMSAGKDIGLASSVWNTIKSGGNAAVGQVTAIADIVGSEGQYQQTLMKDLKKLTEESIVVENKVAQTKARTISVIDAEIKQKKEEQQSIAKTRQEYEVYEQQIKKLEAERDAISGGKSKKSKTVADGEAYREQLNKLYSDINKDKLSLMQDGTDKELQSIKNEYKDKINEINKQEQSLLEAYNKSKGLKKGDKGYLSQLPEEAKDAIAQLKQVEETVKNSKELKLLLGGSDELVLDTSMDALLESTKTFQQKRLDIVGQGMLDIATLDNKGLKDQAAERRKQMNNDVKELEASNREKQKSFSYLYDSIDKWGKKALQARLDRINEDLKNTKLTDNEKLALEKALSETTQELASKAPLVAMRELDKKIAAAKQKIASANGDANKIKDAQKEIDNSTAKKGEILSESFGNVAGHLSNIAQIVGQFNEGLGETIQLASGLAGAFSQIAQGNYAGGIISGAASIITSITQKSAKDEAERRKEQELANDRLAKQLDIINKLYEMQKDLIDSAYGTDKIKAYTTAIESAKTSLDGVIEKYKTFELRNAKGRTNNGGEITTLSTNLFESSEKYKEYFKTYQDYLRLTKGITNQLSEEDWNAQKKSLDYSLNSIDYTKSLSDVQSQLDANRDRIKNIYKMVNDMLSQGINITNKEALDNLISDYEKYAEEINSLMDKQRNVLTGSTYDAVVDSLASAFDDGVVSAEEFTKTFGDLMKNQVLNSLKMQMLEKPLRDFYNQFALASESDGKLTADEVIALRATYEKIAADAKVKFDDLNAVMQGAGLDIFGAASGTKENSAVGIVKNLSENTGSEIVGNLTGMRYDIREQNMTIREQLAAMNESVSVQRAIEANTAMTVKNLVLVVNHLSGISDKLGVNSTQIGRETGK